MDTIIYSPADFGRVIKDHRRKLGYTQVKTAALSGTGTRFISDLENGKATVELGKVLSTAAVLGIDITAKERGSAS
jgi:y4mF family transcriptional regulator